MKKKRNIPAFVFCLIGFFILFYFGTGFFISSASRKFIPNLKAQIEANTPYKVERLDFKNASLTSFNRVTWRGIEGVLLVDSHPYIEKGTKLDFYMSKLAVGFKNLSFEDLIIHGSGFAVEAQGAKKPVGYSDLVSASHSYEDGQLAITNFRYEVPFPENLGASSSANELEEFVKVQFQRLYSILSEGNAPDDFLFEGGIEISLGRKGYRLRLSSIEENGASKIRLHNKDVLNLSGDFKNWFTRGEADVIARNPLKAARLLQIKLYAEKKAEEDVKNVEDGSRDAYRHILWSYLLTKEFGPKLAAEITDAHEAEVPYSNEHVKEMDMVNSRIGREYLSRAVPEVDVFETLRSDRNVILLDRSL